MSKLNKNDSAALLVFEIDLPVEFVTRLSKASEHRGLPTHLFIEELIVEGLDDWEAIMKHENNQEEADEAGDSPEDS